MKFLYAAAAFAVCGEAAHGQDADISFQRHAPATPRSLRGREPLSFRDTALNATAMEAMLDERTTSHLRSHLHMTQNKHSPKRAISRRQLQYGGWGQLGGNIDGEGDSDMFGKSVDISTDGTIVAIGSRGADLGSNTGRVRIFQFNGLYWNQMGSSIDGKDAHGEAGNAIALSANGMIVAIGAKGNANGDRPGRTRVFQFDGTLWTQMGGDLDAENDSDQSGWSIDLSADGTIVAIGAIGNRGSYATTGAGHVRVYKWDGSNVSSMSWVQMGGDIDGEASGDWSGFSVALSADGLIVAIGARGNDGEAETDVRVGHVRVFGWDGLGSTWSQVGNDIDGEFTRDFSGHAVALSDGGTILAIGAPYHDDSGDDGHVRIFEFDGVSSWVQRGEDIFSEGTNDLFGWSVDLSSDGSVVAIGAWWNDGGGGNAGHARIYVWNGTVWLQQGGDIDGEAYGDNFGGAVALAGDGSIVAIGGERNDDGGVNAGHVRVFEYTAPSSQPSLQPSFSGYPSSIPSVSPSSRPSSQPSWQPSTSTSPSTTTRSPTNSPSSSPPTNSPSTRAPTPPIRTGGNFGDPHVISFDGLSFDCQAAGEFITVTSLEDPSFQIQERFTAIESDSNVCTQASVSTAVAISDENTPTIQISIPRDNGQAALNTINTCPIDFYVDGVLTAFSGFLSSKVNVNIVGSMVSIVHTATFLSLGIEVSRSASFGCHVFVQVFVPTDFRPGETILGLLGTPNGNMADDWRALDGTIITAPATDEERLFSTSYNYCVDNWCIKDSTSSIFSYGPGELFEEISACDIDYSGDIEKSVANPPNDLLDVCGSSVACLVDGLCGDITDALKALEHEAFIVAAQEDLNPAPTPVAPTPTDGGCYKTYGDGFSYNAGDWVSAMVTTTSNPIYTQDPVTGGWQTKRTTTTTKRNYKCISNHWCGMIGYKPGSTGESLAWQKGIECLGTATPDIAPTPPLWNTQGGCPRAYEAGTNYDAGDVISVESLVYQCAAEPTNLFCGQTGYAPSKDQFWDYPWTIIGSCFGTLTPSSSPNFASLTNHGGCPEEWEAKTVGEAYEEGDTVSSKGLVFSCKEWPYSTHCGQQGYEPMTNPATPDAWKAAWDLTGYCGGSISPTSSPNFDPATSVGGCPRGWSAGGNVKYEEGDMVSATVSATPLRKVAFRCKSWPYSGHCGQYSPSNELGGSLGWSLVGSCDGSIGPTASPFFNKLSVSTTGCPAEYSPSSTDYEAGDLVAYTVSTTPERKTVYICREFPNTGYCNQSGFKPGSQYDFMGWKLIGACSGSLAPTIAPAVYAGSCTYTKCVEVDDIEQCTPGSTGCSCNANDMAGLSCQRDIKREICSDVAVGQWSESVDYTMGDVVRVGTKRFNCREWPNYLWCSMPAYKPALEDNGIWYQAWSEDGTCA